MFGVPLLLCMVFSQMVSIIMVGVGLVALIAAVAASHYSEIPMTILVMSISGLVFWAIEPIYKISNVTSPWAPSCK